MRNKEERRGSVGEMEKEMETEVKERLKQILKTADLTTTSVSDIRRMVEQDLGVDLSSMKSFIRQQIDILIHDDEQTQQQSPSSASEAEDADADSDADTDTADTQGSPNPKNSKKRLHKENVSKQRGGFTKLCALSSELQSLLGVENLARTQVVKQIWVYIREKSLQDPKNRRKILCDEKLRPIFKKDAIDMFEMNRVLSNHIYPLGEENGSGNTDSNVKQEKNDKKEEFPEHSEPKSKRQKQEKKDGSKGKSGFCQPLPLSDAFVSFIGTGESELSRAEAVKRIWNYIKENNLQDPADKRRIVCDEKLHELFGCDTFNGFGVSKLLSAHFRK